ncbi:MAG: hypothetical protein MUP81_03200 [Dehalococcoidia bacterium]|nr:hypothetical protein [Dehalococcoidia bacterium]
MAKMKPPKNTGRKTFKLNLSQLLISGRERFPTYFKESKAEVNLEKMRKALKTMKFQSPLTSHPAKT